MRSKIDAQSEEAEKAVRDIRRATRRHFSAEDKVRIVIAGLRGEDSVAELCRKEGINQNLYYRWSKDFLEAGKKRLAGDTAREATSDEVKGLRAESSPAQGTAGRADDGEPPAQKKRAGRWGVRYMRYAAAEKLEIIRLVEHSSLPVRRTLEQLGIPRSTFYRWYDRYRSGQAEGLYGSSAGAAAGVEQAPGCSYSEPCSSSRSKSRSCRRGSWRSRSSTSSSTSSRKPRSTGS